MYYYGSNKQDFAMIYNIINLIYYMYINVTRLNLSRLYSEYEEITPQSTRDQCLGGNQGL